jgi:hypothetical protein
VCPKKFGGSYEELRSHFLKGDGLLVLKAFPGESCYEGTAYASLSDSRMPAIAILERDYRALRKLRSEGVGEAEGSADTYREKQRQLLSKGEYWLALVNEISDLLAVSTFYKTFGKDYANYGAAIVQMLQFCKNESIIDLPEVLALSPKGRLISQEQYNSILKQFKLKHEVA